MQSSAPAPDGAAGGRSKAEPVTGATPFTGNELDGGAPSEVVGAEPFTGGKAGSGAGAAGRPGSGAGNAPCASAPAAWTVVIASTSGTMKRQTIKAFLQARSPVPASYDRLFRSKVWFRLRPFAVAAFTIPFSDSCQCLTTRRIWQQRGAASRERPILSSDPSRFERDRRN